MEGMESKALEIIADLDRDLQALTRKRLCRVSAPVLGTLLQYIVEDGLSELMETAQGAKAVLAVWQPERETILACVGYDCTETLRTDQRPGSPAVTMTLAPALVKWRGPFYVRIVEQNTYTLRQQQLPMNVQSGLQTVMLYLARICRVSPVTLTELEPFFRQLDLSRWPQVDRDAVTAIWPHDFSKGLKNFITDALMRPLESQVNILHRMEDMAILEHLSVTHSQLSPASSLFRGRTIFILWSGHQAFVDRLRVHFATNFWLEETPCCVCEAAISTMKHCLLVPGTNFDNDEKTLLVAISQYFPNVPAESWIVAKIPKLATDLFRADGRLRSQVVNQTLHGAMKYASAQKKAVKVEKQVRTAALPISSISRLWIIHCRQSQTKTYTASIEKQLWTILSSRPEGFVASNDRIMVLVEEGSSSTHPMNDRNAIKRILRSVQDDPERQHIVLSACANRLSRRPVEIAGFAKMMIDNGGLWLYQSGHDEDDENLGFLEDAELTSRYKDSNNWTTPRPETLPALAARLAVSRETGLQANFYSRITAIVWRCLAESTTPTLNVLQKCIGFACKIHKISKVLILVRNSPDPKADNKGVILPQQKQLQFLERVLPQEIDTQVLRLRFVSAYRNDAVSELKKALNSDSRRTLIVTQSLDRGARGEEPQRALTAALGENMMMSLIWDSFTDVDISAALRVPAQFFDAPEIRDWQHLHIQSRRVRPSALALPILQPIIWSGGAAPAVSVMQHVNRHVQAAGAFVEGTKSEHPEYYSADIPNQLVQALLPNADAVSIYRHFVSTHTGLAPEAVEVQWFKRTESWDCSCDYENHDDQCLCCCSACRNAESCPCSSVEGCVCPPLCNCRCSYCHVAVAATTEKCPDCDADLVKGMKCEYCVQKKGRNRRYDEECLGCDKTGRKQYGKYCSEACVVACEPAGSIRTCNFNMGGDGKCSGLAPVGWTGGKLCPKHWNEKFNEKQKAKRKAKEAKTSEMSNKKVKT